MRLMCRSHLALLKTFQEKKCKCQEMRKTVAVVVNSSKCASVPRRTLPSSYPRQILVGCAADGRALRDNCTQQHRVCWWWLAAPLSRLIIAMQRDGIRQYPYLLCTITDICFRARVTQPNRALVQFSPWSSHPQCETSSQTKPGSYTKQHSQ